MSAPAAGQPERDALSAYALAARRRWKLVLAIVLAFLVAAVARHVGETTTYEATASVAFGTQSLSDAALNVNLSSTDPEREAATNVLVAQSEEVAARAAAQLGTGEPPADLLDRISVEAAENANVLYITAADDDPDSAVRVANAFAEQYIAFERQTQIDGIETATANLREQLDALPADSPRRAALEQSLQRLTELEAVASGDARLIGAAASASPTGLGLAPLLVVAAMLGLAVAGLAVFVLESLDRRVRSIEEFEREYRLPALTAVPQSSFDHRGSGERDEELEPYRILRAGIDFLSATQPINTLLVTSAVPGEGKTTVAVDLAHAVALTGRPVTLVELDLRRPSFGRHMPLDRPWGVTTALLRQRPLSELLVRPYPELTNLHVLPAGRIPPNPAELLGTEQLAGLLAHLAAEGDSMVILDTAPLTPVADTQVLMNRPEIDGALIVAQLDSTTLDQVRRTRAILDRHVVPPLGLVVTGLRDAARYGYVTYPALDGRPGSERLEEAAPAVGSRLGRSES